MKLLSRDPIAAINRDLRFTFGASQDAQRRSQFIGLAAIGAYIALELRVRGCVVVQGSPFWCKLVCLLSQGQGQRLAPSFC